MSLFIADFLGFSTALIVGGLVYFILFRKKTKHDIVVGFDYTEAHGWVFAFFCTTHGYIWFHTEGKCPHGSSGDGDQGTGESS